MEQSGRGEALLQISTVSSGPMGPSFIPSQMFMQLGDQARIMNGHGEGQGQQETRIPYRNSTALSRFLKHMEALQNVELREGESWVVGRGSSCEFWACYLLFM